MGEQGMHSKVGALAPMSKKLATKPKPNLLGCKNTVNIASFNVKPATWAYNQAKYKYHMHTAT